MRGWIGRTIESSNLSFLNRGETSPLFIRPGGVPSYVRPNAGPSRSLERTACVASARMIEAGRYLIDTRSPVNIGGGSEPSSESRRPVPQQCAQPTLRRCRAFSREGPVCRGETSPSPSAHGSRSYNRFSNWAKKAPLTTCSASAPSTRA